MARWRRTNPLALATLVTLFDADRHPYDIARTLRERHHDTSMRLNFGSLYSVVAALEREGFVRAADVERHGNRPERTVYRITGEGITEARAWLRELLGRPAKEYLAFEAALTLIGALPPDDVIDLLEQRLALLRAQLASSIAGRHAVMTEMGLPRLFLVESEYIEALTHAEITFVDGLVHELRDGSFDGLELWRSLTAGHDAVSTAGRERSPVPPHCRDVGG